MNNAPWGDIRGIVKYWNKKYRNPDAPDEEAFTERRTENPSVGVPPPIIEGMGHGKHITAAPEWAQQFMDDLKNDRVEEFKT